MSKIYLTDSERKEDIVRYNLQLLQGRLSCTQMGKIIGVSKSTYLNRLKNPMQLTIKEIDRICKYFHVDINSFLTEKLTYK